MRKLFIRIFLLSLPVLIIIGLFIFLDPFRVFLKYEDYSKNMYIILNRDYVSTEVYRQNRQKYKYDSFILGSSRTLGYNTSDWRKHLGSDASPFKFDASGENLFGIYKKILYIDKMGDSLRNCLIILCTDCSFYSESDLKGHLFIKHPSVAGTSWFNFYYEFFKVYIDYGFFSRYYTYLYTHEFTPAMVGYFEYRNLNFDKVTNDLTIVSQEQELQNNFEEYYKVRSEGFYNRSQDSIMSNPLISAKSQHMLEEIMRIFNKHNTSYKIVISPLYDQVKLNSSDLEIIQNIFGKNNVFDFSGKNQITNSKYNYYECSHYRSIVGDSIMAVIYKN